MSQHAPFPDSLPALEPTRVLGAPYHGIAGWDRRVRSPSGRAHDVRQHAVGTGRGFSPDGLLSIDRHSWSCNVGWAPHAEDATPHIRRDHAVASSCPFETPLQRRRQPFSGFDMLSCKLVSAHGLEEPLFLMVVEAGMHVVEAGPQQSVVAPSGC